MKTSFNSPVNILVADDHAIVRAGLINIIKKEYPNALIDEAEDGDSVIEQLKGSSYNMLILDVNMPDTDTSGLIDYIMGNYRGQRILIFSMNPEEVFALKFLSLGVKGFLSKTASDKEIANAITVILDGKNYYSDKVTDLMKNSLNTDRKSNPFNELSLREMEVLMHLAKGLGTQEICNVMHLQSSTISTYKARIFEKTGVTNLIQLIDLAKLHLIIN